MLNRVGAKGSLLTTRFSPVPSVSFFTGKYGAYSGENTPGLRSSALQHFQSCMFSRGRRMEQRSFTCDFPLRGPNKFQIDDNTSDDTVDKVKTR